MEFLRAVLDGDRIFVFTLRRYRAAPRVFLSSLCTNLHEPQQRVALVRARFQKRSLVMTNRSRPNRVAISILSLIFVAGAVLGAQAETTVVDLVDALNAVFGKHAGTRAAHSKGICLTGMFTP